MLIKFEFRNFLSFKELQSLSFLSTKDDSLSASNTVPTRLMAVPRITKTALILGANGSGKTNALQALVTMKKLVEAGSSLNETEFKALFQPFEGDRASRTDFLIEVLIERTRYVYSFSYNAERILEEKLLVFRSAKSQRWFERVHLHDSGKERWAPFSTGLRGPREMWRKATRPHSLFLSMAAELNAADLIPLRDWFRNCLDCAPSTDAAEQRALGELLRDPRQKSRWMSLLRSVDLPLRDARIRSDADAVGNTGHGILEFAHERAYRPAYWAPAAFESAGLRRLARLFVPVIRAMDQPKLLLIDELDSHLHSLAARYIIELFNKPGSGLEQTQLLVTTHDSSLMDLPLLRRDAIWLIERGAGGESQLFNVRRRHPRKFERLAKSYLNGRYGAVPRIAPGGTA